MKTVNCATYQGLEAKHVYVESTLTKGLPSFSIVGMASTAITEAKERVKSALLSNDFSFPPKRITINLAPSDVKKEGSQFDLSIALIIALDYLDDDFSDWFVFGELGLDGKVKENMILYPLILSLANQNLALKVIVPQSSLTKLGHIPNIEFYGVNTLQEAIDLLKNPQESKSTPLLSTIEYPSYTLNEKIFYYAKIYEEDFSDVKGQEIAKRAALIAAAGFHNILFEGSPGCGKSMIAKRLQYILPPMSIHEILESVKLQVLDMQEASFKPHRSMRSPHHTSSLASVFGGGSHKAQIGEVGLAHNGILFFDELPHFSKKVLEALREPMQDGKIRISRVNSKIEYKADFLFIGAMNPCPCGNLLNQTKECRCSDVEIVRYKNKLSDPFLDRIDLNIVMQNISSDDKSSYSSKELHKMVIEAHIYGYKRGQNTFNARLKDSDIDKYCLLNDKANNILDLAIERFSLTFRSITKVKKISRTIADLDSSEIIQEKHLLEALSYRKR